MSNPNLQTILKHLDSAKNPKAAMEDAMQEPLFVEFANACLKVVDPSD
jgi:zinc finger HIT domain-containing protein 3